MYESSRAYFEDELDRIQEAGLYKTERVIQSPQSSRIEVNNQRVLNFCANNYLGLADNPLLKESAKKAIDEYGLGLASVRFICGTQTIHKELEQKVSAYLATEDTILYASCFDANGGLFETILNENDAIVSDALNHASIIDGIRLCKAQRYRYQHGNMADLEACLKSAREQNAQKILIATDGVFSMDGHIADLPAICALADQYESMVMIDDCHATGFFGPTGRGTFEYHNVASKIDIITSTFGKALGGAVGGFTSGKKEIIRLLRQRSRPYLFSNSLPPALVAASLSCLELLSSTCELREKLMDNTAFFRKKIKEAGFTIKEGVHPIVPVMLGDAKLASSIADELLKEGIYVIGFSYPVVPKGEARIRVQLSAAHSRQDLELALEAFKKVGKAKGVI
jgi:glycine C-acetyltransferase